MAARSVLVMVALSLATLAAGRGRPSENFCREGVTRDGSRPDAYQPRGDGSYCDGNVFEPHSGGGELPVVSIVAAPVRGNPSQRPVRLRLIQPGSESDLEWPVRIQGLAKSVEINYRLDSALYDLEQELEVGIESAMMHFEPRLKAEDIGWTAWSDTAAYGMTFIPVIPADASAGQVEISVRPEIHTVFVTYTIKDDDGVTLVGRSEAARDTEAGELVTFVIPTVEPRLILIEVNAYGGMGKSQTALIRLIRPESAE